MSTWGKNLKISIFGESHGPAIGVVIDNLPHGYKIDINEVILQMGRRAPGKDITSTPRFEACDSSSSEYNNRKIEKTYKKNHPG